MKQVSCLILILGLAGCSGQDEPAKATVAEPCAVPATAEAELTAQDIADNNRGVALMGSFDYSGARDTFAALVERQPGWHEACINLAIATLNRQQEGDEQRALDIAARVLSQDPGHLRAHYVSGLLRLYLGETEVADGHFRKVVADQPDDAYGLYYLGQVLLQNGEVDAAVARFREAMALDPYLRSAYYRAALALRRSGSVDESKTLLDDYSRLENNPRATLAEFKYTRMGPLAEARAVDVEKEDTVTPVVETWFDTPIELATIAGVGERNTLTTVDLDSDGDQDLYLSGPGRGQLWLATADGYSEQDHVLAQVEAVNAAAWGDVDNDGLVDAYLCRNGPNQLWRQVAPGEWVDITESAGVANGEYDCADVALIDADHDIDLDIFVVNRDGPNELLSNNLDGTFRLLAAEHDIAGRPGSRQALATDIDNDRDLDLVVIKNEPPHELFLNDRLWQYRSGAIDAGSFNQPVGAVVAADLEASGNTELVPVQQLQLAMSDEQAPEPTGYESAELIAADFDGDGHLDIAVSDDMALTVYSPTTQQKYVIDEGVIAASTLVEDPERGPSLVVLRNDGRLVLHPASQQRHPFVAMTFSGKEEQADSMRSNRNGIGTRVALRVGSRWTMTEHI
ncbi:MAG: VCBS repeat-containing protein, partial [Gammaproteobacteria bacterium]|nr:VCBS repeat-containing protein [Gammaproteobacteria bacterium]